MANDSVPIESYNLLLNQRNELLSALEMAVSDLDATYQAIKNHDGPVVSIGQFSRLQSLRVTIAEHKS